MAVKYKYEFVVETLKAIGLERNFKFISFPYGFSGLKSIARICCYKHGEIDTRAVNITYHGGSCSQCAYDKKRSSEDIVVSRLKSKAESNGHEFIEVPGGYKRMSQKAKIKCKYHGEWLVPIQKYLDDGTKCPSCAHTARKSAKYYEEEIAESLEGSIFSFVRWLNGHENVNSLAVLNCKIHGDWNVAIHSIRSGSRCSGCAKSGFTNKKDAHIYFLKSLNTNLIKVGVSNHVKKRIKHLSFETPFDFYLYGKVTIKAGVGARKIEARLHSSLISAGFRGFDGATEWFIANDDAINHINNFISSYDVQTT